MSDVESELIYSYFYPAIFTEFRPSGPVIVRDRRSLPQRDRSERAALLLLLLASLAFTTFLLMRLRLMERLDAEQVGTIVVFLSPLFATLTWWILIGRGREEIQLRDGCLTIRTLPLTLGRGADIALIDVDRLQVESDLGGYRVQIIDSDGRGILPSFGALSGMRSAGEAQFVAGVISRQFQLPLADGVQPQSPRPSLAERWSGADQFAKPVVAATDLLDQAPKGQLICLPSNDGPTIVYKPDLANRLAKSFWYLIAMVFILPIVFGDPGQEIQSAIVWLAYAIWLCHFLASFFTQHRLFRRGPNLVREHCFGPVRLPMVEVGLVDIVSVEAMRASGGRAPFQVIAVLRSRAEEALLGGLPLADSLALVRALHEQFGLPIVAAE